jgi:hypothetical protein
MIKYFIAYACFEKKYNLKIKSSYLFLLDNQFNYFCFEFNLYPSSFPSQELHFPVQ